MGRPKSTTPHKQKLTLTVSAQARMNLEFISKHTGQSISVMLEDWAAKESKRIARSTKQSIPDAEQIALTEL